MKRVCAQLTLLATFVLLAGCGGNDSQPQNRPSTPAPEPDPALAQMLSDGAEIFYQNCATCHMADGSGSPDLIPALQASDRLRGSPGILIRQVLYGVGVDENSVEPSEPGRPMIMTAFGSVLDDQQIAEVLTFTRSEWAGVQTPVKAEWVAELRGE